MRKIHLAPYCVALTVGNCFLPFFLGWVAGAMRGLFHQTIGYSAVLPGFTEFALGLPPWFCAFTVVAIMAGGGLFIRRVSASLLAHWLLVVCLVEGVALIYFTWAIVYPLTMVLWGVGE
jgi:hypothetical protein